MFTCRLRFSLFLYWRFCGFCCKNNGSDFLLFFLLCFCPSVLLVFHVLGFGFFDLILTRAEDCNVVVL